MASPTPHPRRPSIVRQPLKDLEIVFMVGMDAMQRYAMPSS